MSIVRSIVYVLYIISIFALPSCSKEDSLEEMERIKIIGDKNPIKALAMLDSLKIGIRKENNYVKNKYDLLQIRLNDKADNIPNSDIMIKHLIGYFEDKGSMLEKQEVTYYAGSVYRDLRDTPRALGYFLKSTEYAKNGNNCDSIMLRNAYSNLNDLYYKVQNYNDAAKMAQEELKIAQQTRTNTITPYLHLGTAYIALNKTKEACDAFDGAFEVITHSGDISKHQSDLLYLLCDYSVLMQHSKAKKCFSLIKYTPLNEFSEFPCMAFAKYYELCNKTDSVIFYCKLLLDKGTDIYNMYDASKLLYQIYSDRGDINNAEHYARAYMQFSDSMDFGKRQELSATVNNEFQYHLDQKKEQTLKDEKEQYKNTLAIVVLTTILLACVAYIMYVRRHNRHLQQMISLSTELQRVATGEQQLRKDIEMKEEELEESKKSLKKSSNELSNIKLELKRMNEELAEYSEALKAKEQQLSEKIDQNTTFIKLLHQSEMESNAEDVIYAIRQSSEGKKNMTSADWKRLYQAVDELYPEFNVSLIRKLGNITEQHMQVYYLMRIGLSKHQILDMTHLSRVTIWRWAKNYNSIVNSDDATTTE